ncbi:MAG: hypothetical protein IJF73_06815 [Clostridia bacterium]|nr:hypothetical protein [Clostridia bacterium]
MKKRFHQKRSGWFRALKRLLVIRYKEPRFVYLGERVTSGGIIVSNHVGTDAPLSMELYFDRPIRFWGAHEMNSGLIKLYKYQTRVYYHERKHWNLHLARLFCLLASPLTYIFYRGLRLISTYHDARLIKTLNESLAALREGDNIVIFPEDSSEGYLDELKGFFGGFLMLADHALRRGIDAPIYVTYFRKRDLVYFIDKPILYSELRADGASREELAERLVKRCNALGKLDPADFPAEKPQGAPVA